MKSLNIVKNIFACLIFGYIINYSTLASAEILGKWTGKGVLKYASTDTTESCLVNIELNENVGDSKLYYATKVNCDQFAHQNIQTFETRGGYLYDSEGVRWGVFRPKLAAIDYTINNSMTLCENSIKEKASGQVYFNLLMKTIVEDRSEDALLTDVLLTKTSFSE